MPYSHTATCAVCLEDDQKTNFAAAGCPCTTNHTHLACLAHTVWQHGRDHMGWMCPVCRQPIRDMQCALKIVEFLADAGMASRSLLLNLLAHHLTNIGNTDQALRTARRAAVAEGDVVDRMRASYHTLTIQASIDGTPNTLSWPLIDILHVCVHTSNQQCDRFDEFVEFIVSTIIGCVVPDSMAHHGTSLVLMLVYAFENISSRVVRTKLAFFIGKMTALYRLSTHSPEHWLRWTIDQSTNSHDCTHSEALTLTLLADLAYVTLATLVPWKVSTAVHPVVCKSIIRKLRAANLFHGEMRLQITDCVYHAASVNNSATHATAILLHVIGEDAVHCITDMRDQQGRGQEYVN